MHFGLGWGRARSHPTKKHGHLWLILANRDGFIAILLLNSLIMHLSKHRFLTTTLAFSWVNGSIRKGMGQVLGSQVILFQPLKLMMVARGPRGREEERRKHVDTSTRNPNHHFHFSLSCIGKANGNPLQCSCLENPMHRLAGYRPPYLSGGCNQGIILTFI